MPTLEEVNEQLKLSSDLTRFIDYDEVDYLPNILIDGEKIKEIVTAVRDTGLGIFDYENGILVATDKRIIFIDSRWFGRTEIDFPYDNIDMLGYRSSIFFADIIIITGGSEKIFKRIWKRQGERFLNSARSTKKIFK